MNQLLFTFLILVFLCYSVSLVNCFIKVLHKPFQRHLLNVLSNRRRGKKEEEAENEESTADCHSKESKL